MNYEDNFDFHKWVQDLETSELKFNQLDQYYQEDFIQLA